MFDLLTLKPRLVMARPPDIDGRDVGGAAKGLPEMNILEGSPALSATPLSSVNPDCTARGGCTCRLGCVFLSLLVCRCG